MTEPTTAAIVQVVHHEASLAPVVPADKMQLLIDTVAPGLSKPQLELFVTVCNRLRLDPFAKQIYAVVRNEWNERTQQKEPRMTIQTGIDGFRVVAERTHEYEGEGEYEWCGEDEVWHSVWLSSEPPAAARATVYRKGRKPTRMTARWDAYVQTKRDGSPNSTWTRRGPEQLVKCAAALAFRSAFPHDLSGIYTDDEMGQADNERSSGPQRAASGMKSPGPKQLPPQTAPDGPRFGMKWDKDWAGRLIETAPPDVIGKYVDDLDDVLRDPARSAAHAKVSAHKAEVEAVYERIVEREMAAAELRHKSTPPPAADDIADRLQQHVDEQRGTNDTSAGWGLEAP